MAGAVVVGGLAFYMVRQYIATEEAKLRAVIDSERGKTMSVVVANQALPAGAVVEASNMAMGEMPARHVSSRVTTPSGFATMQGRVLNRPMEPGEPLLADDVAGVLIERFSDLLAPGHRAISLSVSALQSHAGMLVPGDFVDLFVILPDEAEPGRKRIVPLLERVRVIAAGPQPLRSREQKFQPLTERDSRYDLITVEVTSENAERITLALEEGEVTYLLRNGNDASLPASESGRAFFGEAAATSGYFYYSNTTARGELRSPPGIDDPVSGGGMPTAVGAAP